MDVSRRTYNTVLSAVPIKRKLLDHPEESAAVQISAGTCFEEGTSCHLLNECVIRNGVMLHKIAELFDFLIGQSISNPVPLGRKERVISLPVDDATPVAIRKR